jgi:four helix bundle protein
MALLSLSAVDRLNANQPCEYAVSLDDGQTFTALGADPYPLHYSHFRNRFRARFRFRARARARLRFIGNFRRSLPIIPGMSQFSHERLDVYRTAVEWLVLADDCAGALPKGRGYLADQLRRAAASICLNIAEGAGEFAAADKARFYRMARRSATECAAILDGCRALRLLPAESLAAGRSLLWRIVAMLTAMALRHGRPGAEAEAGTEAGSEM